MAPPAHTPDVPIFYATTEGQTARIAEYLAAALRDRGVDSRAIDVAAGGDRFIEWSRVRALALGASLHLGKHQSEAIAFVGRHLAELNAKPSVFFSVSLSAASRDQQERDAAVALAEALPRSLDWAPGIVRSLGGRLAYTKYGFFKRLMLKRIARKEGAPTDTSRDYEFTDWNEVDRLADCLAEASRIPLPGYGTVPAA